MMTTHNLTTLDNPAAAALRSLLQSDCMVSDSGTGRPVLILHGGGGTATMAGLARQLASEARVIMPTHPGFDGSARPAKLNSVTALAQCYLELLARLDLRDVVVIGSSLGGWIAAEMALLDQGRIAAVILLNAVGIQVDGVSVVDVSGLPRPELIRLANHNPEAVLANTPPLTPERLAILAANGQALEVYDHGAKMMVPGLRERLATVTTPALVLWGVSDGIAPPAYGMAYAQAFQAGSFKPIQEAGHLPQLEQADIVLEHVRKFIGTLPATYGTR